VKVRWLDLRAVSGVVQGGWLDLNSIRLIDWIPSSVDVEEASVLKCVERCVRRGPWVCGWRDCGKKEDWPEGQKVWVGLDYDAQNCEVRHWECHEKLVSETVF
jgi:hypothetical protein